MEWILYASAGVIALAFAILVYHMIRTLKSVQSTLESAAATMNGLEVQLRGVSRETEELLKKTNGLVDDFSEKASSFDGLFESVKGLGENVHSISKSVMRVKSKLDQGSEQFIKSMNFVSVASNIYGKWQDRKKDENENKEGLNN